MNGTALVWRVFVLAAVAAGCNRAVSPPNVPATSPKATNTIPLPVTSTRQLGERIESGKGYRLDEDSVVVVHLAGSAAEMQAQYRVLLAEEVAAFQAASRGHRGLQPYLGGCSNLAAFGPASTDGSLWHGRNFDFSGHGVLDRFRIVYIVQPEGKIPYVTISWSGPPPWNYQGVHTAMNARGLSLGYMISQAAGESINDAPSLWDLYRNVMENAGTIDEALAILQAGPRRGAANLLLADGKGPDAVLVEMSSSAMAVRSAEDGTVYSTNHFVSAELFDPENKDPDSAARFQRLKELAVQGDFDLGRMISALRDRVDVHTRLATPDGDIVGGPLNMLSVVFHPADLTFWVANGDAPAAYRQFVGFNLRDELDGRQAQTAPETFPAATTLGAAAWAEIAAYQAGRRAYDAGDDAAAADHYSEALEFNPRSPRYGYALALALRNLGRTDAALKALDTALEGDPQSVYRAYIYFELGQIYQERGQQEEMRAAFEQVLAIDLGDTQMEDYARHALGE